MSEQDRQERFKRVASLRVDKVLFNIRSLSKCSNTSNYSYTRQDVNKMWRAVDEELRICKAAFRKSKKNNRFSF